MYLLGLNFNTHSIITNLVTDVAFRPGLALGYSFGTPPRGPAGQRQSPGLDLYDLVGLTAKFP
jgi:hypothetical protein